MESEPGRGATLFRSGFVARRHLRSRSRPRRHKSGAASRSHRPSRMSTTTSELHIMLIEDSRADAKIIEWGRLARRPCPTGSPWSAMARERLDYLFGLLDEAAEPDHEPDLILLDINLPGIDGCQVLRRIKADPQLRIIPVIVLTTSDREEDVLQMYQAGANTSSPAGRIRPIPRAGVRPADLLARHGLEGAASAESSERPSNRAKRQHAVSCSRSDLCDTTTPFEPEPYPGDSCTGWMAASARRTRGLAARWRSPSGVAPSSWPRRNHRRSGRGRGYTGRASGLRSGRRGRAPAGRSGPIFPRRRSRRLRGRNHRGSWRSSRRWSFRGEPHVGHDDVGARLGQEPGLFGIEGVGCGEQVELMGRRDQVDFQVEAHPGLLEVARKRPSIRPTVGKFWIRRIPWP